MRRCIIFLTSLALSGCSLLGGSGKFYAWNYPAVIDSAGVVIQIGRILIAEQGAFDDELFEAPYFQDKPVISELIFVVKNNSAQSMNVYPDQGHVVVEGEQINLFDLTLLGTGGDSLGGEILPGVTKIGRLWFGLRRTALDDIKSMVIVIPGPHDNYFNTFGGDYRFQLDLSEHKSEPIPDELK